MMDLPNNGNGNGNDNHSSNSTERNSKKENNNKNKNKKKNRRKKKNNKKNNNEEKEKEKQSSASSSSASSTAAQKGSAAFASSEVGKSADGSNEEDGDQDQDGDRDEIEAHAVGPLALEHKELNSQLQPQLDHHHVQAPYRVGFANSNHVTEGDADSLEKPSERGMYANRSLGKGEVLLAEQPFMLLLDEITHDRFCFNCGKRKFPQYASVEQADYCSSQCFEEERYARELEKEHFFPDGEVSPRDSDRRMILFVTRAICRLACGHVQTKKKWAEAKLLMSHNDLAEPEWKDAIREDLRTVLGSHASKLIEMLAEQDVLEEDSELSDLVDFGLELAGKINCNAYGITVISGNGATRIGGFGIFPKLSMANHDCTPNCVFQWNENSGKMCLHVIRDIRQDEQITIHYTDLYMPTSRRRQILKETKRFECMCLRCTNQDDGYLDAMLALPRDLAKDPILQLPIVKHWMLSREDVHGEKTEQVWRNDAGMKIAKELIQTFERKARQSYDEAFKSKELSQIEKWLQKYDASQGKGLQLPPDYFPTAYSYATTYQTTTSTSKTGQNKVTAKETIPDLHLIAPSNQNSETQKRQMVPGETVKLKLHPYNSMCIDLVSLKASLLIRDEAAVEHALQMHERISAAMLSSPLPFHLPDITDSLESLCFALETVLRRFPATSSKNNYFADKRKAYKRIQLTLHSWLVDRRTLIFGAEHPRTLNIQQHCDKLATES